MRWAAVHSEVTAENGFVDTQRQGPFRGWRHYHRFRAVDEQTTEVIDEIGAEFGSVLSRFLWFNLPLLFAYRARQTRKQPETGN